jgi:hypothetical protein
MQERTPIWLVRDRWGRDIILYEDIWFGHILVGHPDLWGLESAVARVLEYPHRVMFDMIDDDRECYYQTGVYPQFPDAFVKVCVEFGGDKDGFVVTAFIAFGVRSGEVPRWP